MKKMKHKEKTLCWSKQASHKAQELVKTKNIALTTRNQTKLQGH